MDNQLLVDTFYYSVCKNHFDIVQYMVNKGFDIHHGNDKAFLLACRYGHMQLVQYFLDKNVNINTVPDGKVEVARYFVDADGLTVAIQHNQQEIVNLLIERGIELNLPCSYSLPLSIMWRNMPLCKKLIDAGYDISAKDVLKHAVKYVNWGYAKQLIELGSDIHADNDYALRRSAGEGNMQAVIFLLEQGASINALPVIEEDYGEPWGTHETALGGAAGHGDWDMFEYLVQHGADIHINDDEPLRMAVEGGNNHTNNYRIIDFLLNNGANVHANDDFILKSQELYASYNKDTMAYIFSFKHIVLSDNLKQWFIDNKREHHLKILETIIFKNELENILPVSSHHNKVNKI